MRVFRSIRCPAGRALSWAAAALLLGTVPAGGDHHVVTPDGSPSGDGSRARPWDLATALAGASGRVGPGDTVWVGGGRYAGQFVARVAGERGRPVVILAVPGARPVLDGAGETQTTLVVTGDWVVVQGLEITNSRTDRTGRRPNAVYNRASHTRYRHLVIHDAGVAFFSERTARDVVVSGSIIYNNGWEGPDWGFGHGLYLQGDDGPVTARGNVVFNQFGYGIHVYADRGSGRLRNIHLADNIVFNSGTLSRKHPAANILVGGRQPADAIRVIRNVAYFPPGAGGTNVHLGLEGVANGTGEVTDNIVLGGTRAFRVASWRHLARSGNRTGGPAGDPLVAVVPDADERGRAFVAVYNPARRPHAAIPLADVLEPGDVFTVRNVQALDAPAIVHGAFTGDPVSFPLEGVSPPVPVGMPRSPAPRTGPVFDVFLVRRAAAPSDGRRPD